MSHGHSSFAETLEQRRAVAEAQARNPGGTIPEIARITGYTVDQVRRSIDHVRADYNLINPGAVAEMRARHTTELDRLVTAIVDDIFIQLKDPEAERTGIAQMVNAATRGYERLAKMHAMDAPREVNLNTRLLRISVQTGIPLEELIQAAPEAVALLKGD